MNKHKDTIFALATPGGKSALATIRISGKNSLKAISSISSNMPKKANQSSFNKIITSNKKTIDDTVTTYFKSPKSYTGEDMVEISIHGSGAVIKQMYKVLNKQKNFRIAEPGEFTRRAFENNKLDLTQAEAIMDMVNSETEEQRKLAYKQLSGQLTNKITTMSEKLLTILANVEAVIDFSEDDLPNGIILKIEEQIKNISKEIKQYIKQGSIGEKIRSGFIVAIIGKPNTGKSSFINKISERDVAIVTNEPGTTRDTIEVFFDFKGLPIKFYDTAGLQKAKNKAEKIGINKANNLAKIADINLVFIHKDSEILKYNEIKDPIFIKSKSDLRKKLEKNNNYINISSKTGYGVNRVFKMIQKKLCKEHIYENISVSRERHREALGKAVNFLQKTKKQKKFDLFAEDIRLAMKEMSKITGKSDIEDILEIIFNEFCIGK